MKNDSISSGSHHGSFVEYKQEINPQKTADNGLFVRNFGSEENDILVDKTKDNEIKDIANGLDQKRSETLIKLLNSVQDEVLKYKDLTKQRISSMPADLKAQSRLLLEVDPSKINLSLIDEKCISIINELTDLITDHSKLNINPTQKLQVVSDIFHSLMLYGDNSKLLLSHLQNTARQLKIITPSKNLEIHQKLSSIGFESVQVLGTDVQQKGLGSCMLLELVNSARMIHKQPAKITRGTTQSVIYFYNSKWKPSQEEITMITKRGYSPGLSKDGYLMTITLTSQQIDKLYQDPDLATADTYDLDLLLKVLEHMFIKFLDQEREGSYMAVMNKADKLLGLDQPMEARSLPLRDGVSVYNPEEHIIQLSLQLDEERHQYKLLHYNKNDDMVTLFNPWGRIEEYSLRDLELHYDAKIGSTIHLVPVPSKKPLIVMNKKLFEVTDGKNENTGIYYSKGSRVSMKNSGVLFIVNGTPANGIYNNNMYINGIVSNEYKVDHGFMSNKPILYKNNEKVTGEVAGIYFVKGEPPIGKISQHKDKFNNPILYDKDAMRYEGIYKEKLYRNGELAKGYVNTTAGMFENGKLLDDFKGDMLYEKGQPFTGIHQEKPNSPQFFYLHGKLLTGAFVVNKKDIFICKNGIAESTNQANINKEYPDIGVAIEKKYTPDESTEIKFKSYDFYKHRPLKSWTEE